MAATRSKELCLLSLDGGGVRGLASLLILKRIMFVLDGKIDAAVERPLLPCNYFDLMAGTSTGGLIAIMLGKFRMDIDTCIAMYLELAPQIFPTQGFISGSKVSKLFKGIQGAPRFNATALETLVKSLVVDKLGLGEDALFEAADDDEPAGRCKTFVCVTNKDVGTAFRLRSYRSSWEPGTGCTVWQAARATSAAPFLFPPIRFGFPPANYIDGGLRYNNPVRALYDEANHIWPASSGRKIGCVISIGAGVPPLRAVGDRGKAVLESLVKMALDTQETASSFGDEIDHVSRTTKLAYIRLNVEQGMQDIGLEEWKEFEKITGATNHYLNNRKAEIEVCASALRDLAGTPAPESGDCAVLCQLPDSSPDFFGRISEMEEIRDHLNPTSPERKSIVLWGLSGFGKSRLALRYIELYRTEFSMLLWIDASTLDAASESFSHAAMEISRVTTWASPHAGARKDINFVRSWLAKETNKSWLLVIDSVDDLVEVDCRQFIPSSNHGRIIITSTQSRTAAALKSKGIEITGLDEKAGCEMLLSKLDLDHDSSHMLEDAAGIVRAVDGIPLAIEQAGAVLQDGVALEDLLSFYGTQYRGIMDHTPGKSFSNYEKGRSVFKTFELLYGKLTKSSLDAANVLTLCSFFGSRSILYQLITHFRNFRLSRPDQSYSSSSSSQEAPQHLLIEGHWLRELLNRELDFRQAIMRLEKLCLAKVRKDAKGSIVSWSIHNAICRWLLETLEPSERSEWALLTAHIVCAGLRATDSSPQPAMRYSTLVKHCRRMLKSHLKPNDTEPPNGTLYHQYGLVMVCFAEFYLQSQCPAEVKEVFEAAIEYETVIQGSSWPQDLRSLNLIKGLATSMWKQGSLEQAVEAFEFLFESSTEVLGALNELTIWAANRLRDIRDRKIAHSEHEERVLMAATVPKQRELEDSDSDVIRPTDLAPEYLSSDIPDKEWTLLQLVEESRLEFGELHYETLAAVGKVARFYEKEQKYPAAEGWLKRRWRIHVSMHGIGSVDALSALNILIQLYKNSGRYIIGSPDDEEQCLQELLGAYPVARIESYMEATAISYAILYCDELVLRLLIEWGADVNARSEDDETPLHLAAMEGLLSHMHLLIENGAELSALIYGESSALTGAAAAGHTDVVRLLLDAGSDVDECKTSETALMCAAEKGHAQVIQILLGSHANTNIQGWAEFAALHLAALRGHGKVVELLLEGGADPDIQTLQKYTALHFAAAEGHEKVAQLLLEGGADPDIQTLRKGTALHFAAGNGHEKVAQLLLEGGADPDIQGLAKQTALRFAAAQGHQSVVHLLLAHKASIHQRDVYGKTALHSALK